MNIETAKDLSARLEAFGFDVVVHKNKSGFINIEAAYPLLNHVLMIGHSFQDGCYDVELKETFGGGFTVEQLGDVPDPLTAYCQETDQMYELRIKGLIQMNVQHF